MIYYLIVFTSLYAALLGVTVYGIIEKWYWFIIAGLIFINVFVIGFVIYFCWCAVLSLFVNKNKPIKKQSRYFYHLMTQAANLVLKVLRVKIHVSGREFIPKDRRFLMVCNHIEWIDPAVGLMVFRKHRIAFISRKENYAYPVAGKFLHKTACLPIDRENNRDALRTINRAAEMISEGTCAIGIFPEGWVTKTGELQDFRNGAFRIAKKAECPVVVTHISGTDKVFHKPFWKRCDVYYDIKGVVPAEFVLEHKTAEIGNYARELMLR